MKKRKIQKISDKKKLKINKNKIQKITYFQEGMINPFKKEKFYCKIYQDINLHKFKDINKYLKLNLDENHQLFNNLVLKTILKFLMNEDFQKSYKISNFILSSVLYNAIFELKYLGDIDELVYKAEEYLKDIPDDKNSIN